VALCCSIAPVKNLGQLRSTTMLRFRPQFVSVLSFETADRCVGNYCFASAAVTVDSSHMTASSSASWSIFSPPSNVVNGGTCRQCGSWSVAGHNHKKVIGQFVQACTTRACLITPGYWLSVQLLLLLLSSAFVSRMFSASGYVIGLVTLVTPPVAAAYFMLLLCV